MIRQKYFGFGFKRITGNYREFKHIQSLYQSGQRLSILYHRDFHSQKNKETRMLQRFNKKITIEQNNLVSVSK